MKYLPFVFVVMTWVLLGCDQKTSVPESGWQVSLGTSGGVTGGGGQTVVYSDGKVESQKWDNTLIPTSEPIGNADLEMVKALGELMSKTELVTLEHKNYSNMSTSLTWEYGKESRTYVWEAGSANLPESLQTAIDMFERAVDSAESNFSD
jgi:hypothetical protein